MTLFQITMCRRWIGVLLPVVVAGASLACWSPLACGGEVVTVAGERFAAELVSIDDRRVVFQTDDAQPQSWQLGELVRWGHPVPARPRPQVLLADGSRLVAAEDWSGEGAIRLGDETLTVVTQQFDAIEFSRRLVVAAMFIPPHAATERHQLADALRQHDEKSDKLWLAGGDRLSGTVTGYDGRQWTVDTGGREVVLPATRVEAVAFNPQLVDQAFRDESDLAVGFRDGSIVYTKSCTAESEQLQVTTTGGAELVGGTAGDIVTIQVVNQSLFHYLSDMEPADYRHVPYLEIEWPWHRDRNLLGGPLATGDAIYLKGIAMHAAARLTYAVEGSYRTFAAEIAIDDAAGQRGSAVFRVFVARDREWQDAFTSDVVRGGDPPQPISVDIQGAQAITLIVDYADRGDELDHADWLDARLVK